MAKKFSILMAMGFALSIGEMTPNPVAAKSESTPLGVDTEFFSPNGDGSLDRAAIRVSSSKPWKLIVVGHGPIESGSADRVFNWDGYVGGVKLPDGIYRLTLEGESLGTTSEASIVIDTAPPQIRDITIDGSAENQVIQSIIPELRATINDDLSSLNGVENIELLFVRKIDNYTTKVYQENKKFDSTTGSFSYRVPFEEDSILYLGDQWVEFNVTDRAGNKAIKRFWFAVGMHNKY